MRILFLALIVLIFSFHLPREAAAVSAVEDLMREHGALSRILLIYEESLRRLNGQGIFDPALLKQSAEIVHRFIEGYHEKLEEDFIFPRFRNAGQMVDLVQVLKLQHERGRVVTEKILSLAGPTVSSDLARKSELQNAINAFIRMYRPHKAREDTVLFPAFKKLVSRKDYDALGEKFEDREHKLFGKSGFEGIVQQITGIEKTLGIFDLARFTPR